MNIGVYCHELGGYNKPAIVNLVTQKGSSGILVAGGGE